MMFDIGFFELLVIGVIALVVLGPERLPKAASTVGRWVGKAKRTVSGFKAEIDREVQLEEMKKKLEEHARQLQDATAAATNEVKSISQQVSSTDQKANTDDDGHRDGNDGDPNEPYDRVHHGEYEPYDDEQESHCDGNDGDPNEPYVIDPPVTHTAQEQNAPVDEETVTSEAATTAHDLTTETAHDSSKSTDSAQDAVHNQTTTDKTK